MNLSMTALTQNSKICNFIELVTFIYMMNMELLIKTTNKALWFIGFKSPSPVKPLSVSIIWIIFSHPFMRIKVNFSTFIRTEVRSIFFRFLNFIRRRANFTRKPYFSIPIITSVFPAFSRTEVNSSRFILFNIPWAFVKSFFAPFAKKLNLHVSRVVVTCSGAKSCSIFFKQIFAGWTYFHKEILTLAKANVNLKEVINGKI